MADEQGNGSDNGKGAGVPGSDLLRDTALLGIRIATDTSYGLAAAVAGSARAFGEQIHDDELFKNGLIPGIVSGSIGAASVAMEHLATMGQNILHDLQSTVEDMGDRANGSAGAVSDGQVNSIVDQVLAALDARRSSKDTDG